MVRKIIFQITMMYALLGHAQLQQPNNSNLQDLAFYIDVNNRKYANAEGSKYIFEEFKLATIKGISGSHLIRFDPVDNIIQLKKEDNKLLSLSKKYQYKIELLDGSGIYETRQYINENGKVENTFFEKIHATSNFSLYKKHRIKFQPSKPAKSSYEPAISTKFIKLDPAYYLMNQIDNSGYLVEIPRKNKALLNFFGKQSDEVNKFIKKNKLKTDIEADLIKIIDYYFESTLKR